MKEKEYIITWLKQMAEKFPWLTFKYELLENKHAHCVEVYPKSTVESSEEYCAEENRFASQFEVLFGDSVLFSIEDEMFKCSTDAVKINGEVRSTSNDRDIKVSTLWCNLNELTNSDCVKKGIYAGENNYALAA